jgi:hypothetical protein
MHGKRNYTKGTNEYWSGIIFKQRAANIYEEMSLVADKYSENDPVPCYLFLGKYYRRQHRIWVFVSFVQKIAI